MPGSGSAGPQLCSVEEEPRALWSEGGTLGRTEGLHIPERQPRVTPTHRNLAADYQGSRRAAVKAEGLPHCDLGHGTLEEEGTLV